jgi:hypothetical protein
MDKSDLKSMWRDVHITNQDANYDKVSIEKSIAMNHSKAISKIISDVKIKIFISATILIIYVGLMSYALIYLGLSLSASSLIPLTLAGLFLVFLTTSEIIRLLVLTKTADNMPVKEALLFFRKRLNRIRTFDFLSYLIILYLSAILIIINYLSDIGCASNLSLNNETLPFTLVGFLVFMLLLSPWLIRYQFNQRYKKIYETLNDSTNLLNDAL